MEAFGMKREYKDSKNVTKVIKMYKREFGLSHEDAVIAANQDRADKDRAEAEYRRPRRINDNF
jgi:hypothetical protein